jgi:tetratricopeptide (TPR) repeat protein
MAKSIHNFKSKEVQHSKSVVLYYRITNWLEDNKKIVLGGVGVFILIIAAVVYYGITQKESNQEAGTNLTKILPQYESAAYLQAIDGDPAKKTLGLKKIAEQYSGTENGESAKIYLANAYSYLGKSEEAFKYYNDYSGSSSFHRAAAEVGKAGYYEVKKDFEKALESYEKAASFSKENPMNAQYLLNAALMYIELNNKEKAKELLISLKTDFPKSTLIKDIDRYLAIVE